MITVIITSYNSSSYIRKTIDSVYGQKNISCELIVVDDHSDDYEELERIANRYDESILLIQPPEKGNANISRNIGIKYANSEYIAFLDADDTWEPYHLANAIDAIKHNDLDLCLSRVNMVSDGKVINCPKVNYFGDIANYIFSNGIAVTSSIVCNREALLTVMFDEKQLKHQDWDFLIRFETKYKIGISNYAGLNYTLSNGSNMSSSFNETATVRFLNNTLPKKYHKKMLMSQLRKMIENKNHKSIAKLSDSIQDNYNYSRATLGLFYILYITIFKSSSSKYKIALYHLLHILERISWRISS